MTKRFAILLCTILPALASAAERGFSDNASANNQALLVAVSHGLPGLNIDLTNMQTILSHGVNQFTPTILNESEGTVSKISAKLTELSKAVDSRGTLFFYFTGHGAKGLIQVKDRTMKIAEIRSAIEAGRVEWGPLKRLVLFFDSCHSGSLLDPLRASQQLADEVYEALSRPGFRNYWANLFVFASARADETCDASAQGSAFTLGVKKGWDKTMAANGTLGDFVKASAQATTGSHPGARFDPASLENEKLTP